MGQSDKGGPPLTTRGSLPWIYRGAVPFRADLRCAIPCYHHGTVQASHSLPAISTLLVLLALGGVAGAPPAAAQGGLQQTVEDLTGVGGDEASGEEAKVDEGILPDKPPEPRIVREALDPGSWPELGSRFIDKTIEWLPSFFAALLVLLAFFVIHWLVNRVLRRFMARSSADPAAQTITLRLTRYVIFGLGVVMAASQMGINVGSLLAGVGILGLALGLAAQDSLANLVAGLTILWDRPFRIGDNVTVSETFGTVKEIGLRTTRIRTVEQLDAILPNKEIINQKIVNHTLNPMMRLGIPISIAYKEDTRAARKALLAAVKGHDLLLEKPAPEVVVEALGESSVDLLLRVWLRDPFAERDATYAMIELAKIALDEAKIEIPFPQRTLHFPGMVRVRGAEAEETAGEAAAEVGGPEGAGSAE